MGVKIAVQPIALTNRRLRFHFLAAAMIVALASGLAVKAHAAPVTTSQEAAQAETAGRPVKLDKFSKRAGKQATALSKRKVAKKAAANAKFATKRGAKYARIAHRVQKASQKFTIADAGAQPRTPSAVNTLAGDSLKPLIADARAEMSTADLLASGASTVTVSVPAADVGPPEPRMQVVSADQVNDIDRAASAAEGSAPRPGQILKPVSPQRAQLVSSDSAWDQTSLIGKLFVAFGGFLTLASAARMFFA